MPRKLFLTIIILVLLLLLCACSAKETGIFDERNDYEGSAEIQFTAPQIDENIAIVDTDYGKIYIKLFYDYAPMAVDNFTQLANAGSFNNLTIHRVSQDFLIQTGDTTGTGTGGTTIFNNTPYPVEITDKLHHYTGAVGIAHEEHNTNSNLSQFYIIQTAQNSVSGNDAHELADSGMREEVADAYKEVGGAPYLDNNYTIFGHVIDGMTVVDEIAKARTDDSEKPNEDIYIKSVQIVPYSEGMTIPVEVE